MIIPLGTLLPTCSSDNPEARRTTYERFLFVLLLTGFATTHVTMRVGVSYTSVSPLPLASSPILNVRLSVREPLAVYFLLHFPSPHGAWQLASVIVLWSSDFPL